MVDKDYIENLVISCCRRLLSEKNIHRIAKEVVAIYEAQKDETNLKRLKGLLQKNEKKQQNAIACIMECDIESVRKALAEQIPMLEQEHTELERQIASEEAIYASITEPQVEFFLTSLKRGNINAVSYTHLYHHSC